MLSTKYGPARPLAAMPAWQGGRVLRRQGVLALMLGAVALALAAGLATSRIPHALHWQAPLAAQTRALAWLALGVTGLAALPRAHALSGWRAGAAALAGGAVLAFGPLAMATLAGLALACWGLGQAVLTCPGDSAPAWAAPLAGLALLILALNAAEALGLDLRVAIALLTGGGIFAAWQARAQWQPILAALRAPSRPLALPLAPAFALILAALGFATASAALPERLWDGLAMHLLIPTQIAYFGHFPGDARHFAFSFFPLGADHVFAAAFLLGGEAAAKAANWAALLALLGLLFAMARARAGQHAAVLAVLAVLATPAMLASTASLFVEPMLGLLILAALALLEDRRAPARLALVLVLAALPGIKLHGALIALAVGALALAQRPWREAGFARLAWRGSAAIALGLVPFAHAWIVTGNPVFPMLNPIFRSPFWPAREFADARWQHGLSLALPWRLVFQTSAYMECWDGALGFALPLLIPAGIAAALTARGGGARRLLAVVAFYLLAVFATVQYLRYAVPVFAPLALLGAEALGGLADPRLRRGAAALVLAAALAGMLAWPTGSWSLASGDFRALIDPARRAALLRRDAPVRVAVAVLNRLAGGHPRVLIAADPFGALLRGHPVYVNWYDPALAAALARAHGDGALLRVLGSQHLDYAIGQDDAVDGAARRIAALLARRQAPLARIGSVAIYRLTAR